MRKLTTLTLLGTLAAGAFAFAPPPADACRTLDNGTPDDTSDDLPLCTVARYLSCETAEGGKAQILAPVGTPNAQLTEERPSVSFTAGGGCGEPENSFSTGVVQDNIHDFTFEGLVAGNIDSLAVELHDFNVSPDRGKGQIQLGVRVLIDDQSPFGMETITTSTGTYQAPRMVTVTAESVTSSTGATESYTFTITGIGDVLDTMDPDPIDRYVKITIDTPDGGHVFVWGATEIPAGILTNPLEPLGGTLQATG